MMQLGIGFVGSWSKWLMATSSGDGTKNRPTQSPTWATTTTGTLLFTWEGGVLKGCVDPSGSSIRFGRVLDLVVQGDQLNLAVLFWYLGKSDFSVYGCAPAVAYTGQWTSHFSHGTRKTLLCLSGCQVVLAFIKTTCFVM